MNCYDQNQKKQGFHQNKAWWYLQESVREYNFAIT